MEPGQSIAVIKRNLEGAETWRYTGQVLEVSPHSIVLEAYFNRADLPFHGLVFARGDRFIETYYTDRWYNIFEIHDRDSNQLKGWYCNICMPAKLEQDSLSYIDLALDLLVYPDKKQLILDEDEFAALALSPTQRKEALAALAALRQHFQN